MSSTACLGSEGDEAYVSEGELTDDRADAVMSQNALTANALTANALTANALTANALTANALTANSLLGNDLSRAALEDPAAQQVLHYVVGCALPAGAEVEIELKERTLLYRGQLGLAPEWGKDGGVCDGECQSWVSACVLARINNKGVSVPISMRGPTDALEADVEESKSFVVREATYFGNIFSSPQVRRACVAPGAAGIPRVCGEDTEGCIVDVVGECDDICGSEAANGSFFSCAPPSSGSRRGSSTGSVVEAITIFLAPR